MSAAPDRLDAAGPCRDREADADDVLLLIEVAEIFA